MKIVALSLKNVLMVVCLSLCVVQVVFSQGNDSIRGKGLFIGISFGPAHTRILNEGTSAVSSGISNRKNGFTGIAEIGYNFSKYIGLSSGIGYSSYQTRVTLDAWQSNFNAIDTENESFEMRASGTGIAEDQKLSYLNVPVYLNFRLPLNGKIGLFLQSGVKLAFLTGQYYSSDGTFTYKGYYSKYNVLLENLPQYGFPTSKAATAEGKPGVKSFTVFAVATAGVDFNISDKFQLAVAGTYNKSISPVSDNTDGGQYQLSQAADQIHSLMGGSSKVTIESLDLSLMLRHYF